MIEFFNKLLEIISTPGTYLAQAADALNSINITNSPLIDYLGYIKYAMGTPLYVVFSSAAVIGLAVTIFKVVMNAYEKIMTICGFK